MAANLTFGTLTGRSTSKAASLIAAAREASEVRAYQVDPDVIALRIERTRAWVDRLIWTGMVLGLAFTAVNVQAFAARDSIPQAGAAMLAGHPLGWWAAWLLDPLVSLILIGALIGEQIIGRYGLKGGPWVRALKWVALGSTYAMNTWSAWAAKDPALILLHSIPPVMVFCAAEAVTDLRHLITEAVNRAYRAAVDRAEAIRQAAEAGHADTAAMTLVREPVPTPAPLATGPTQPSMAAPESAHESAEPTKPADSPDRAPADRPDSSDPTHPSQSGGESADSVRRESADATRQADPTQSGIRESGESGSTPRPSNPTQPGADSGAPTPTDPDPRAVARALLETQPDSTRSDDESTDPEPFETVNQTRSPGPTQAAPAVVFTAPPNPASEPTHNEPTEEDPTEGKPTDSHPSRPVLSLVPQPDSEPTPRPASREGVKPTARRSIDDHRKTLDRLITEGKLSPTATADAIREAVGCSQANSRKLRDELRAVMTP